MATILIVDDHAVNREYLVTLLRYQGHRLLQAADGADGIAVVTAELPDLVIADILMPTMDGFEFVRRLRAIPAIANTRVIFYSAHYLAHEASALAQECGVTHVLTKPTEPEVVLRTVELALGEAVPIPTAESPHTEEFEQEHLRVLTDKLARKAEELSTSNERLNALIELSLQLGSERDPERLLHSFCSSAREILGARCAAVGILDRDGKSLKRFTTSGMTPVTLKQLFLEVPRQPVLETILSEGRSVRVATQAELSSKTPFPAHFPGLQAYLGVPIVSPARTYGWLCLFDRLGADEFSAEDERLANILAAMVGRIYENGSLYAELLHHTRRLEDEVLERSRVQEALRESEERVRRVLDTANDAFITINPEGGILEWNRQAEVLFGWSRAEATGNFLAETIIPPQHREAHQRGLREFQNTGYGAILNQRVEVTALRRDGTEFPVELLVWPTDVGDTYTVSAFIRDITDRKQAEETLRYTTKKARCLLWHAEIEETGAEYLHWRARLAHPDAAQAFFPLEVGPDEEYLDAWLRARPREGLREMADSVNAAVRAGQGYTNEFQARDRNGQDRWLHEDVQVEIIAPGRWRAVGVVTDITERKTLEEQFRQSQMRLEHVVSSSPTILFTATKRGNDLPLTWISRNLRDLLGYEPEEAFDPTWWASRIHPDDLARATEQRDRLLLPGGQVMDEYRFRTKSGEYRWMRSELRLPDQPDHDGMEVVGAWTDVTERKLLEEQFQQAQKMESIGRLAGGIAHDFNNMLAVILGYGELLLARQQAGDPSGDWIEEMVAAAKRAAALTRQLLVFSRKALVEPRVLDLQEVVTDMDRMLRRIIGEDIQLTQVSDPHLGSVKADLSQVEQVLLNLAVNARDAMGTGGSLTVELRNVELDQQYADHHADVHPGRYVLLAVTDTGCGMDAATQLRVFEPFFTTKGDRGTGMGLATVYGIAKQSGGHVAVYSEVGTGTCFKVYFPRVDEVAPTENRLPEEAAMRGTGTVLLVEDDDAVRSLARLILQECGYTVLEASSGVEALRIAAEAGSDIQLLVTDVVMPQISGREVAERLEPLCPGLKVLYLSGYTDDAIVRHGILQAEVAFLQKPFSPTTFARKVKEILED